MGLFLNTRLNRFKQIIDNSQFYVDKTELIAHFNQGIFSVDRFKCVSRARRFGKSIFVMLITCVIVSSFGCSNKAQMTDVVAPVVDEQNTAVLSDSHDAPTESANNAAAEDVVHAQQEAFYAAYVDEKALTKFEGDNNHNLMLDSFETAANQGKECRVYADCDTAPDAKDGFCDSVIGYQCSTRCTSDDQCVNSDFYCRSDGRCASKKFETVWRVEAGGRVELPVVEAEKCNFTLDWGDGTVEKVEKCPDSFRNILSHEYKTGGEVHVAISGELEGWGKCYGSSDGATKAESEALSRKKRSNNNNLIDIISFGPVSFKKGAFQYSSLAHMNAIDIPDAGKLSDLEDFFLECKQFNGKIERWDVSNVTNMERLFSKAESFNQPIEKWDVSNVTNMSYMFSYAKSFNQPIESWDVSHLINMSGMFHEARAFNQPIEKWNVSNVELMQAMFEWAVSFNQPLNAWNVSKVKKMFDMFIHAESFNQPLDLWNIANVEDISGMFVGAKSFNQPLDAWNISNVKDMSRMFCNASSFNQELTRWNSEYHKNIAAIKSCE